MPPFKSLEEKEAYIIAHQHLFKALGIQLVEEELHKIVLDKSQYDRFNAANEIIEKATKRSDGYDEMRRNKTVKKAAKPNAAAGGVDANAQAVNPNQPAQPVNEPPKAEEKKEAAPAENVNEEKKEEAAENKAPENKEEKKEEVPENNEPAKNEANAQQNAQAKNDGLQIEKAQNVEINNVQANEAAEAEQADKNGFTIEKTDNIEIVAAQAKKEEAKAEQPQNVQPANDPQKPEEVKPEEVKPEEVKAEEQKPENQKPEENKAEEAKPENQNAEEKKEEAPAENNAQPQANAQQGAPAENKEQPQANAPVVKQEQPQAAQNNAQPQVAQAADEDEFDNYKMGRMGKILYDPSDTPEAKKWNADLKAIIEGPNAVRRFSEMCMKAILEFDDSVMAGSLEDAEKALFKDEKIIKLYFVAYDMVKHFPKIFDMNNPREAALVKAVEDKYLLTQGLEELREKYSFESTKLFTILPADKLDYPTVKKLLDAQYEHKGGDKEMNAETMMLLSRYAAYKKYESDFVEDAPAYQKLASLNLLGKPGIYYRTFRLTDKGKEYISKNEVVKALKAGKGLENIKYEEVSAADRAYIDDFLKTTRKIEEEPVWKDKNEKRAFIEAIRPALGRVGIGLSDKKITDLVEDTSRDVETLRARELSEKFKQIPKGFSTISTDITGYVNTDAVVDALYLNGDTPEIRQWNEDISLLAQSKDGIKQIVSIAAKRLLSVNMADITEADEAKRTQYLLDHPVERQLLTNSNLVMEAYKSTLPAAERSNDPVIKQLGIRANVLESMQSGKNLAMRNASRLKNLFPNLTDAQIKKLNENVLPEYVEDAQGEKLEMLLEASLDTQLHTDYNESFVNNKKLQTIRDLYSKGIISDKTFTQTISATILTGNPPAPEERQFTFDQMIEAISENTIQAKDFRFADAKPEETEKLNKFMNDTPDKPTFECSAAEKRRLHQVKQIRTFNSDNASQLDRMISELTPQAENDPELKKLLDACKKNNSGADNHLALITAFKYVNDHQMPALEPLDQKKFELAMATVAALDKNCATELARNINIARRNSIQIINHTRFDLKELLTRTHIKASVHADIKLFDVRNPFDKRLQNVKEIYEHLKNDLDPWYHHNSDDFNNMMKSMKNVLEYANMSKNPNSKVIEEMLKEVKETSKTYMKDRDPNQYLGKNRSCAALAVVAALDPAEGESLLKHVCKEKFTWARQLCNVVKKKPETITTRDVMNREKLTEPLNKADTLKKMQKDITHTQRLAVSADMSDGDRADLIAEYIVKRRLYNNLKSGEVDKKEVVDGISKTMVSEAGKVIAKDDIYRSVIESMKFSDNKPIDKDIEKIDREFMKREKEAVVKEAERKAAAEAAAKEAAKNEKKHEVPAPEAPTL